LFGFSIGCSFFWCSCSVYKGEVWCGVTPVCFFLLLGFVLVFFLLVGKSRVAFMWVGPILLSANQDSTIFNSQLASQLGGFRQRLSLPVVPWTSFHL